MNHIKIAIIGGIDVNKRIDIIKKIGKFDFIVFGTSKKLKKEFDINEIPYAFYKTPYDLFKLLKKHSPFIVHTYDTIPSTIGRLTAKLAGVPIIIGTFPGLGSLYSVGMPVYLTPLRLVLDLLIKISSKISNLNIFQNFDDLEELTSRKLVNKKCVVISGSGVNLEFFTPQKIREVEIENLKRSLNINSEFIVIMISRLLKSKGVIEFAIAAEIIKGKKIRNIKFFLVGGIGKKSIDALSEKDLRYVKKQINWLGERKDVRELLKLADVFVLPSYYREGIPRVLMEAGAMGKPLIAADVPGSREVVISGYTGLLVKPRDAKALADAIVWMKNHPNERKVFGENARKLVEKRFDINIIAKQTAEIYERLINEFRGKG